MWRERPSSSCLSALVVVITSHRFFAVRRLLVLGAVVFLLILLAMLPTSRLTARRIMLDTVGPKDDVDLTIPPRYNDLRAAQENLPQHNLSLPYPEGETGRYVKFSSQPNGLGWNNVLAEL